MPLQLAASSSWPAPARSSLPASARPSLLIADDELLVLKLVEGLAQNAGFDVTTCSTGADALRLLLRQPADLAMVDLRMPDVSGLELLRRIRRAAPGCEVILMTGYAAVETAIEAIRLGAREYLEKPFDVGRLQDVLAGVRVEFGRRARVAGFETAAAPHVEFCGMVGRSQAMQEVFGLIQGLAPHAKAVLLGGETGTGKELAARAFHRAGPRRTRPFVTVNCAAAAAMVFESMPGAFEAAQGGTLFLDEVGELPLDVQARLLRTLKCGEAPVDVTVIAATSRDLRAAVAAGCFRASLFYRLNVVEVELPPLRERREDIPCLAAAFLAECAKRMQKPLTGLTTAAERLLCNAPWDGNVRELKNVVERACMLSEGRLLSGRDIAGSLGPIRGVSRLQDRTLAAVARMPVHAC